MESVTLGYKDYIITTDKNLMNIQDAHKWLSERSYWCAGIPYEVFKKAFDNSFCIGAMINGQQVAFGRLVTDYATYAYLMDVYVDEAHRGKGIGKKMMELLMDQEWIKGLRAISLATKDAHELYRQFGFAESKYPERIMGISKPDIYQLSGS